MPQDDRSDGTARSARGAVLAEALDELPQAIAVFGADGGLLFWNGRYADYCDMPPGVLRVGLPSEALIRRFAASGRVPASVGREEEWVAERLRHHAKPDIDSDHHLDDGRWFRLEGRRTRGGLRVLLATDITEVRRREASLRLLFESNPVPILVQDRDAFSILAVNDAATRLFGHGRDAFLRLRVGDLCAAGRSARLADGMPWRCRRADGTAIDLLPYSSDFIHDGRPAIISALVDMTEVRRGEQDLHRTRAFLDSVVQTIPSIVFAKDMADDGRYVLYNKTGGSPSVLDRRDVIGRTDLDLFPPALAAFLRERDAEALRRGGECLYDYAVPQPDGTSRLMQGRNVPIAGPAGEPARYVLGVADDITERRGMESRLARAARCDDLTGLPNRLAFVEMLGAFLRARDVEPEGLALLLVDLDEFRVLNDALGQITGDALLRAVGERLAGAMRGADGVARLGADQFVVVQSNCASAADATDLAARLLADVRRPFLIAGQALTTGASIGIALAPPGGAPCEPDLVLRHAELALRHAKAGRRGGFQLFEPRMDDELRRRRALEQDLRSALDRGEFELFFQPQVDLASETVTGFEALVRWRHPVRGLVNPLDFISVTEETGVIVPLGAWVLARACAEAMTWPVPVKVAVNLSPVQFLTPGLGEAVAAALAASGLPPERLELEITESVRLIDNDANLSVLHRFRDAGIQVALDDFGTGFASLSYLRAFPFNKIKIDRSFVRDLGRDEGCLAIVRATTSIARDRGMDTLAKDAEPPLEFLQLRQLGCAVGQGYLFGRPCPAGEVAAVLTAPPRWAALAAAG